MTDIIFETLDRDDILDSAFDLDPFCCESTCDLRAKGTPCAYDKDRDGPLEKKPATTNMNMEGEND